MSYDEDERKGDFKLTVFYKNNKNMPLMIRVIMAINHTALLWLDIKSAWGKIYQAIVNFNVFVT